MLPKAHNITSLKSPKTTIIKKALIIGAAATGLIIAGALVFAATLPLEVEVEAELAE